MVSTDLQPERRAMRARIEAAFRGVTRDGGVSWNEASVIDDYGTPEEERAANASDRDRGWMDLVKDPEWQPEAQGYGGFSFLDPIGFLYYLPAAMMKCFEATGDGPWIKIAITLELPEERKGEPWQKWSLLNERQGKCVAAFVRFMIVWDKLRFKYDTSWQQTLDSYWGRFSAKE